MKKETLLLIDACISANQPSRTYTLCEAFLKEYKKNNSDAVIEINSLVEHPVPFLTPDLLEKRNELVASNQLEHPLFHLAHQFANADRIVIGAPYWDLSFPAVLKAYIEQIMATNIAFHYIESGSEGLCKAKSLTYLTTSGGYIEDSNFGFDYIRGIAKMTGIPRTDFVAAEGLDIIGNQVSEIMKEAVASVTQLCSSL